MATLGELAGIDAADPTADDALRAKTEKAMLIAARAIEEEDAGTASHAERLALAKAVYADPEAYRDRFLRAMVAANAAATISGILGASDSAIQSAVDAAWDTFIEVDHG